MNMVVSKALWLKCLKIEWNCQTKCV